jgi:dTDP-4-dehydrorhamnose 3,5-epimerase
MPEFQSIPQPRQNTGWISASIMRFEPAKLKDAWIIALDPARDSRGYFARTFSIDEFAAKGLETSFPQHSISHNAQSGTLRGMHFQRDPHGEVKLVRCVKGAIWDVIIDIRPTSPTFGRWQGFALTDQNGCQLYIPKGFAHGFQTLSDDVVVNYLISEPYAPQSAAGLRYNDPKFNITWPLPVSVISEKDTQWPDFTG